MKKLFILLVMIWICSAIGVAQTTTILYEYDNAGNRVIRKVGRISLVPPSPGQSADTSNLYKTSTIANVRYLEEFGGVVFNIYPNPTDGQFRIEMKNGAAEDRVSIYLHSIGGELIFRNENAGQSTLVDISQRDNGTYLLTFVVNQDKRTWKVIKH